MSLRRRKLTTTVAVLSAAALTLGAPVIVAGIGGQRAVRCPQARLVACIAPFQVAVRGGTIWWTDGFAGKITRLTRTAKKVIANVNGETPASRSRARSSPTRRTPGQVLPAAWSSAVPDGRPQVANLQAYESTPQPRRQPSPTASSAATTPVRGRRSSSRRAGRAVPGTPGIKDSHPYQVEALPERCLGGRRGRRQRHPAGEQAWAGSPCIALLPRQADHLHPEDGRRHGCSRLRGRRASYAFEPVPTDVERDRRGNLWVSTAPGWS